MSKPPFNIASLAMDAALAKKAANERKSRDYFAGQALTNAAICTGKAEEYELEKWFSGR